VSGKKIIKHVVRWGAKKAAPLLYAAFFRKTQSPFAHGSVCLSFDCDLPEDYDRLPALLDTLDAFGVRVSFGIIGKWLEKLPRLHARIVEDGHEIMNHTQSHPNNETWNPDRYFNQLTFEEQRAQVLDFESTCQDILGIKPVGFRTPHFGDLNVEGVYRVLEERGYLYSTSTMMTKTRAGGLPYYPRHGDFSAPGHGTAAYGVLEMPVACCPVHYFPAMDSVHCVRQQVPAHPGSAFYDVFCQSVNQGLKEKRIMIYDFGPQDVGGLADFERMLSFLRQNKVKTWRCQDAAANARQVLSRTART